MENKSKIIVVDGCCQPNPGIGAYQGFDITDGHENKKMLFRHDIVRTTTNNVAEYVAIVHAIGYMIKNSIGGYIFSDSQTAIAWINKRRHNSNTSLLDQDSIDLLNRADKFMRNIPLDKFDTFKQVKFWSKKLTGIENPADFGNKY